MLAGAIADARPQYTLPVHTKNSAAVTLTTSDRTCLWALSRLIGSL